MKKHLSFSLLVGAGGLVYALWDTPPGIVDPDPDPDLGTQALPDSYADAVEIRRYGPDGQLLDRTDAASLRRFLDPARVELQAPTRWGHEGDAAWTVVARSGEYTDNRSVLRLSGDVNLRYSERNLEFQTQEMEINFTTNAARSLTPVRAWQGDNETVADRLFINLDKEAAVLYGGVRSVYQPVE
jgi:LPS export ABC transporter protein LptC